MNIKRTVSDEIFNTKIGEMMELLEVANNDSLKRAIRSKVWNLKKELESTGLLEKDCINEDLSMEK